ncbi:MAG TPA: chemotaxis protein CheW [Gemmatimonadaceae bacterium]|jgi:purine-binding chemotaxis protein CheW
MFRDGVARLLVFRVGAERFALPLESVDGVVDAPAVQRVPDSGVALLGITMLRDAVVRVYDPRPILNVGGAANGGGALLIFLRDDRRVGLAVDDVFDALTIEEAELRPAPGLAAADEVVLGVVRRGSDLTTVLDVETLLGMAAAGTGAAGAVAIGQGEKA